MDKRLKGFLAVFFALVVCFSCVLGSTCAFAEDDIDEAVSEVVSPEQNESISVLPDDPNDEQEEQTNSSTYQEDDYQENYYDEQYSDYNDYLNNTNSYYTSQEQNGNNNVLIVPNIDYSSNAESQDASAVSSTASSLQSSQSSATETALQEGTVSSSVSSQIVSSALSSELTSENIDNIVVFDLLGTGIKIQFSENNIIGLVAWAVIIIGIIIITTVLIKSRRNKKYGSQKVFLSKKRYKANPYGKKKKRLLSDKYRYGKYR